MTIATTSDTARHTTGTAMVTALEANGVRVVFGIPGTHNIELYRGLDRSPSIQHVLTKHEQGAAYAADGYARATGSAAVVITTSGPGLTNALTGMANAYADSIPMLVISPAIPVGSERSDIGWLHEMKDQRAAVDNIVDRSIRAETPDAAVAAIHEAFARWRVERPRPVHIEVPLDVLEAEWTDPAGTAGSAWPVPTAAAPDAEAVARIADLASADARVVIIAGGGSVDAGPEITRLAERLGAPVVTTTLGKGVIDEHHPLSVGEFAVQPSIAPLLAEADLVLAIGTELNEPGHYRALRAPLVRVDIDPSQLHKNVRADIPVHAEAGRFAAALLGRLGDAADRPVPASVAATRTATLAELEPFIGQWREIQRVLSNALPAETIVTGDSSQVSYLGTGPYWQFSGPRQYIVTTGFSTLGYSLPAAIGAKLAHPDAPVVCIVGDGAFLFSMQEVLTAAELGISLPIVVVDNHGFAEIRQNMKDAAMPPLGVDYRQLDLEAFAAATGTGFARADEAADLPGLVSQALETAGPTLIAFDTGRPE